MSMNKVFLFINTEAHIPTIFAVAELLQKSGRYRPIIFFSHAELCQVASGRSELYKYELYVSENNEFSGLKISDTSEEGVSSKGVTEKIAERQGRRWLRDCLACFSKSLTYGFSIVDYILMCLRLGRYSYIKYVFNKDACFDRAENDVLKDILLSIFHKKMMRNYGDFSRKHPLECRSGMFHGIYGLRKYGYKISLLMEELKPVLMILPEENLFYKHYILINAAHDKGIRCCVVPFTVANQKEWLAAFFDDQTFQEGFRWNGLFIATYPNWSASYKGRRLVLPGLHIFLSEYLKCAPRVPWLINSGTADVIAAESEFMMDFYRRSGIEESRLRLTGSISDDRLYKVLKDRENQWVSLKNKLSIPESNGNVFLIALPPDQFSHSAVNQTEFQNHQELIDYMLSMVMSERGKDDVVLVNLHPRTSIDKIALPSFNGLYVVNDAIENLVPLSDLFIAVSSATIRLAVSCGIQVINYNAYGYDYDEYREIKSVVEVNSKEEYGAAVRKYIGEFSEFGRAPRENNSLLDGLSDKRLLDLFDALAV